MKKILLLAPVFLLACCGPVQKKENVKADAGNFTIQAIDKLEDDSTGILVRYELLSDTMAVENYVANKQQGYNPFIFFLVDTSGKYQVGDTLELKLKQPTPNTY